MLEKEEWGNPKDLKLDPLYVVSKLSAGVSNNNKAGKVPFVVQNKTATKSPRNTASDQKMDNGKACQEN